MLFNYKKLSEAIKGKMFAVMSDEKRRIGLREIAPKIGISTATLSRCYNGAKIDVDTLCLLLNWIGKDFNEFVDK